MSLRDELVAIGVPLPEDFPVDRWAAALTETPCRNTLALVGLSSLVFLAAERDHNAKVKDIYDAMVYTSTCLSVGYGDIFAKTPIGKVVGTLLMTVGPALSGAALDGPANERRDATQEQILETLRQILTKLEEPQPPVQET
ncbi:MAG TPA: potassium channel family protein [Tepidisphaeraceae bacterium]